MHRGLMYQGAWSEVNTEFFFFSLTLTVFRESNNTGLSCIKTGLGGGGTSSGGWKKSSSSMAAKRTSMLTACSQCLFFPLLYVCCTGNQSL